MSTSAISEKEKLRQHEQSQQQQQRPQQLIYHPPSHSQKQTPSIPRLSPLPTPGIYCLPQCIAQTPTSLILRDRLFSFSGSAEIHDVAGNLVFSVRGNAFSMSRRKEVLDARGQLLFTVRAEVMSIPPAFYCEAPDGSRFMDVEGKWSLFSRKSVVHFVNSADGKNISIPLNNDWLNSHAELKLENGHVIACIDRDVFSARSMFGGASTYQLTVAEGMDVALCVAMCIAMDERVKASRGS